MTPRPEIERSVKPRKTEPTYRAIISVSQKERLILLEQGGTVHDWAELPHILLGHSPAIIVTQDGARLLLHLDGLFKHDERWQYRVTPVKRRVFNPLKQRHTVINGTVVNFFGWQKVGGKGKPKRASHFHFCIDPYVFTRMGVGELLPDSTAPEVGRLLEWAQDVRDWMARQGIKSTPSNGGVGGQLLKDPRFFPEARRKVPRSSNGHARRALPGNFYRLYCPETIAHSALYLDMSSAHHNIARTIVFPDPDTLRARGHFTRVPVTGGTDGTEFRWRTPRSRSWGRILSSHGIFHARISAPRIPRGGFTLPYLERGGQIDAYVHSNEVEFLLSTGATIEWITAAWTSYDASPGLNRYAEFAIRESVEADANRKRWLKPTLLATYGVLATRPRVTEFGYRQALGGVVKTYPAGSGQLSVRAMISKGEQEIPTVNVVYRGLIEAEQRVRALTLARDLTGHGVRVLAIYADSVFVESPCALPLLPPPWRVEAELDRLRFFNSTSFHSSQLTRLPGVSRATADRVRRIEEIHRR